MGCENIIRVWFLGHMVSSYLVYERYSTNFIFLPQHTNTANSLSCIPCGSSGQRPRINTTWLASKYWQRCAAFWCSRGELGPFPFPTCHSTYIHCWDSIPLPSKSIMSHLSHSFLVVPSHLDYSQRFCLCFSQFEMITLVYSHYPGWCLLLKAKVLTICYFYNIHLATKELNL